LGGARRGEEPTLHRSDQRRRGGTVSAPQPEERDVDRGEVSRRGARDEKPVGPQSSVMKPMTIAMIVLVVLVVAYAIFGSGWIL
jgi:hypothetical protein